MFWASFDGGEILDVADQMGDAELQLDVFVQTHVLLVRTPIVATDSAVEFFAQDVDQNLAAA